MNYYYYRGVYQNASFKYSDKKQWNESGKQKTFTF